MVAFAVYEPGAQGAVLPVRYRGVIPDTFMENSEVVVEGALDGQVFAAHTLLAKCPSKYEGLGDEDDRKQAHEDLGIADPLLDASASGL